MTQSPGEYKPNRRDVLRPVEYVGGAAIAAVFTGVITLVATRDLTLALIATGGVFIIVLVVLALLSMAVKPDASESAELHEHDARPDGSTDAPRAGGDDGRGGGDGDRGDDDPEGPAAPPRGH